MKAPSSWRATSLVREAQLNVFSRTSRLRLLLVMCILGTSALSCLSAFDWLQMQSRVRNLEAAGWSTVRLEPTQGGTAGLINPVSCAGLTEISGVSEVWGITNPVVKSYFETGSVSIPTLFIAHASSKLTESSVNGSTSQPSALLGADVVSRIGGQPQQLRPTDGADVLRVAGRLAEIPALAEVQGSVGILTEWSSIPGTLTACIVTVRPESVRSIQPALSAALQSGSLLIASRWIGPETPVHPYDEFLQRSTTFTFLGVGLLFGGFYWLSLRARSSEVGVYRCSGTGRLEMVLIFAVELLILGAAAISSGLLSSFALHALTDAPDAVVLWTRQLETVAGMIVVGLASACRSARIDTLALLKDR